MHTPLLQRAQLSAWIAALCIWFTGATSGLAIAKEATLPVVTAATLKYGTANWELQLIKARELDNDLGFQLEIMEVNSPNAASVALQAGAADVAVQDWLWVLKQREQDRDYRFIPFSTSVGRLMVPKTSSITTLEDLAGRELGVAGGNADKGWRLLQVVLARRYGDDFVDQLTPRFAAPPLLNQLGLRGDMDAVLSYWHYAARLEASGFRELTSVSDVLKELGVTHPVPMLGWSFSPERVGPRTEQLALFFEASNRAKSLLATGEAALWELIRPWMRAANASEFAALQRGYVAGIPKPLDEQVMVAMARVSELYRGASEGSMRVSPELFSVPAPPPSRAQ